MSKEMRKHSDNKKKKIGNFQISKSNQFKNVLSQQSGQIKQQYESERVKSLESMMIDIQHRQNIYEQEQIIDNDEDDISLEMNNTQEKSRKIFYREFQKVIDGSDIIIEVLDARDPLGCRCTKIEETILTSGKNKKLILLLNKIDLIPRDNLDRWLKYLRNEFPTIAFRSSTQKQRDRLGHMKTSINACDEQLLRSSNKCIGASTLMNLLSNYCRKNDIKTSITVGVVGYPNVGKSSVINSLKRSQACETGAMPGVTKQMQTVKLDKLIKLFDSPGIVMSKEMNLANLILRNSIRIETIENPIPAIELLLHRCTKEQILLQYNLNDFQDVNDFLSKLAIKMGCLRKGGIIDIHQAAQRVLSDWNNGRLTYFTEPPERTNDIISTELVTQMREAFDIDTATESYLQIVEEDDLSEIEDNHIEIMEEDENENQQSTSQTSREIRFTVQAAMGRSKRLLKQRLADLADKQQDDEIRQSIQQANLNRQQEFKKMKKNQKRSEKTMENLGNAFDSIVQLTQATTIEEFNDDDQSNI